MPVAPDSYDVALRGQGLDRRFVRLPGGSGLSVAARYHVAQVPDERTWIAVGAAYRYSLFDVDGHEILSYQWHPEGHSHVTTPHLHLGGGVAVWRDDLSKAHLPAGRVTLEDVLLLAIEELDLNVTPLRADWRDILTRT